MAKQEKPTNIDMFNSVGDALLAANKDAAETRTNKQRVTNDFTAICLDIYWNGSAADKAHVKAATAKDAKFNSLKSCASKARAIHAFFALGNSVKVPLGKDEGTVTLNPGDFKSVKDFFEYDHLVAWSTVYSAIKAQQKELDDQEAAVQADKDKFVSLAAAKKGLTLDDLKEVAKDADLAKLEAEGRKLAERQDKVQAVQDAESRVMADLALLKAQDVKAFRRVMANIENMAKPQTKKGKVA